MEFELIAVKRPDKDAPLWKQLLHGSLTTAAELSEAFDLDEQEVQKVIEQYPVRLNSYYGGLIKERGDAVYNQCIPDIREITLDKGLHDPLNEEALSPVPGLTHKYPDRVLFLISDRCAVYCRFCNRKRKIGRASVVTEETVNEGLFYIRTHSEIRDVLLSGGDPLLLEDHALFQILNELRSMPHVEIIRIGTRVPCTLPQRVTPGLTTMLRRFHPLYVHTHFNHPAEITEASALACTSLAEAGIPVGCQTVLLKGINDSPSVIKALMQRLLTVRVRPYYLFQADLARGTSHFWTPLNKGLDIIANLQGHTTGLCVPHFTVDLPGGGGKVNLVPESIMGKDENTLLIRDYMGNEHPYPVVDE